jgi:hypothetical protein
MYKLQLCDELVRRIASYASHEGFESGKQSRRNSIMSARALETALQSPMTSPTGSILTELPERSGVADPASPGSIQSSRKASMRSLQSYMGRDYISMRSLANPVTMPSPGGVGSTVSGPPAKVESHLRRAILDLASKGPGYDLSCSIRNLKVLYAAAKPDYDGNDAIGSKSSADYAIGSSSAPTRQRR